MKYNPGITPEASKIRGLYGGEDDGHPGEPGFAGEWGWVDRVELRDRGA